MNNSVLIYHIANVVNMASWLVTDILWVRLLAVGGNALTILYYAQHADLYQVNIWWHITYIAINAVQIGVLLYGRRPIKFSKQELDLFRLAFVGLSPSEFQRLLRLGHWMNVAEHISLAKRGEALDHIMIIVHGKASVQVDNAEVSELVGGNFVGEISFIHGGPATADVTTMTPSLVVSWNKIELRKFLRRNSSIANAWQIGIGHDLVRKVRYHTDTRNASSENPSAIVDV